MKEEGRKTDVCHWLLRHVSSSMGVLCRHNSPCHLWSLTVNLCDSPGALSSLASCRRALKPSGGRCWTYNHLLSTYENQDYQVNDLGSQGTLLSKSSTMSANLWKVTDKNISNGWTQVPKQPPLTAHTIIFSWITSPSLRCSLILPNEQTINMPKNRAVERSQKGENW